MPSQNKKVIKKQNDRWRTINELHDDVFASLPDTLRNVRVLTLSETFFLAADSRLDNDGRREYNVSLCRGTPERLFPRGSADRELPELPIAFLSYRPSDREDRVAFNPESDHTGRLVEYAKKALSRPGLPLRIGNYLKRGIKEYLESERLEAQTDKTL